MSSSKKNNNPIKSQEPAKNTTYKCFICNNEHKIKEICPILASKVDKLKISDSMIKIWGSLFLQCVQKDISFIKILVEAAEYEKCMLRNWRSKDGEASHD